MLADWERLLGNEILGHNAFPTFMSSSMHLTYRQKIAATTILVVLIVIILLGLAEGTVRLRQWLKAGHAGQLSELFQVDDGLLVLVPGSRTRTIIINSLGFRGPPLRQHKTAGGLRIAFLGASTTYCAEVSGNERTWPHLASEALQQEYPNLEIDYVNAAVPGYTVKKSLQNFRRRVAPLDPDVTIIYHATNDLSFEIRNLARNLAKEMGIYKEATRGVGSWLAEHSQLWFLVVKNLYLKELQTDVPDNSKQVKISLAELGEPFREALIELVNEAKAVSGLVVLVTFSHQIRPDQTHEQQLRAAASAMYYMPFLSPPGLIATFDRYNQIIAEVARETGSLLIDGETMIPANDKHFNDSVHFKHAGSRIMAQRASQALLSSPEFQSLAASIIVSN